MSVKIINGDMVLSYKNNELDAYAQQCNCFCRQARGLAPLLVNANPDVLKVDKATVEGDKNKLGTVSIANTEGFPLLFNVYGQYHWSKYKVAPNRNTDYDALEEGLQEVLHYLQKGIDPVEYGVDKNTYRKLTLGLPLIGCGLAGGDWDNVVLPMIKGLFEDSVIDVTIFVL